MDNLALISGVDIPVPDLGLVLHQPTIKDIAFVGELKYFSTLQILCFNRDILIAKNSSSGSSRLEQMTNFDIFMTLIHSSGDTNIKTDLVNVLTLFLPTFEITFLPQHFGIQLHSSKLDTILIVNDINFESFRQAINDVSAISHAGQENSTYNPKNKKAAEIAAKLLAGRSKAQQQKHEASNGVLARYVSILTIGLHSMSLQSCLNLTLPQLYDLIERYGLYVGWDLDIRSRLAGGKPDKSPDDWMKDIH